MTIAELIHTFSQFDLTTPVVVRDYKGGCNDAASIGSMSPLQ